MSRTFLIFFDSPKPASTPLKQLFVLNLASPPNNDKGSEQEEEEEQQQQQKEKEEKEPEEEEQEQD